MVSVVITTYNRKAFLREAVLSVLNQDYKDKEVIVVDDGSTDRSFQEVRGLPIRYLWKQNRGISSARNAGITISRGDYLAFLDVDDLWKKSKLSTQVKAMEEGESLVSYTDEIWMRNGKRVNQRDRHKKYSGSIFERCLPLCIISPSSVVIKRDVFSDVGLFDESLPVCEDYEMWLRISSRYSILFVDKLLIVKKGGHKDQLSRRYEAMDRFRIEGIVKILCSGRLDHGMAIAARAELERKCRILANGATKRGKFEEADQYLNLIDRL